MGSRSRGTWIPGNRRSDAPPSNEANGEHPGGRIAPLRYAGSAARSSGAQGHGGDEESGEDELTPEQQSLVELISRVVSHVANEPNGTDSDE